MDDCVFYAKEKKMIDDVITSLKDIFVGTGGRYGMIPRPTNRQGEEDGKDKSFTV